MDPLQLHCNDVGVAAHVQGRDAASVQQIISVAAAEAAAMVAAVAAQNPKRGYGAPTEQVKCKQYMDFQP